MVMVDRVVPSPPPPSSSSSIRNLPDGWGELPCPPTNGSVIYDRQATTAAVSPVPVTLVDQGAVIKPLITALFPAMKDPGVRAQGPAPPPSSSTQAHSPAARIACSYGYTESRNNAHQRRSTTGRGITAATCKQPGQVKATNLVGYNTACWIAGRIRVKSTISKTKRRKRTASPERGRNNRSRSGTDAHARGGGGGGGVWMSASTQHMTIKQIL